MLCHNCKRLNFVHNKRCPNPSCSPQDLRFVLSTVIYYMRVMNHLMISLFPKKVCVYRMSLANFWDVTLEAIKSTDMAAAKTHRYDSVRGPHPWCDSRERPSPALLDVCTFPCVLFSPEEPWLGPSFPSVSPLCFMLAHPEIMVHDAVSNTGCYSVGLCWAVASLSLTGSPPNYYLSSSLSEDFHDNGKPN